MLLFFGYFRSKPYSNCISSRPDLLRLLFSCGRSAALRPSVHMLPGTGWSAVPHSLSYLSRSLADRWGTTVDLTTSFLHSSRFSAFRSMIFHSRPIHSLMLSSHRFLCLPLRQRKRCWWLTHPAAINDICVCCQMEQSWKMERVCLCDHGVSSICSCEICMRAGESRLSSLVFFIYCV